ncbi:D-alanine--D-alanine ligase family protein [Nonomuraea sp. NPDC050556]|uniref:D-alanine--D-alanine ligase family protein n=1 Tax=Nonomuraea sp. NPDC050556 TaxID=3364369 RepID=UPI0037AEC9CA
MAERLRVAVLAGGPSAEHDVSLMSAAAVLAALPLDRYEPLPIVIGRDGSWASELRADVVFPVLHGPFGEDGTLQGHLETLGLPYVGCGVLASAIAMDKVAMRRAFTAEGLPVTPAVSFSRNEVMDVGGLDWPMYVKPASLGSSIGITRATTVAELHSGVDQAFGHGRVVLVEQGVDARELVCGVLGGYDAPRTSPVGEIKVGGDWLDYETKYFSEADNVAIPADLPPEVADQVRALSLRAFRAIGGYGLARVDFLYEHGTGHLYVLEINTMPGFTPRSVYARAWAHAGLPYPELLSRLIDLALERKNA